MTLDERLDQVRYLVELQSRLEREIAEQEKPFKAIARWLGPEGFVACCSRMTLEMGGRSTEMGGSLYFEYYCEYCETSEGFYVPMGYFSAIT